jgi:F-type H+-transporting ATPase subunit d
LSSAANSEPIGPSMGALFNCRDHELILRFLPQQRSAALKLDWAKVTSSLGLRGQTVASLQAFKQRNENARRKVQLLSEQPTAVDFAHYRSVLKNQAVIDEIEKRFKEFKPASYDVARQLKAIDAFEVEAVKNAQATKEKVDLELKDLEATLKNIETARPFEELTVVCRGCYFCRLDDGIRKADDEYRTRLRLPSLPSTRRPRSWFPRAAGPFRATRYRLTTVQLFVNLWLTAHYRKNSAISPYYRRSSTAYQNSLPFVYSSIVDSKPGRGCGSAVDELQISSLIIFPLSRIAIAS